MTLFQQSEGLTAWVNIPKQLQRLFPPFLFSWIACHRSPHTPYAIVFYFFLYTNTVKPVCSGSAVRDAVAAWGSDRRESRVCHWPGGIPVITGMHPDPANRICFSRSYSSLTLSGLEMCRVRGLTWPDFQVLFLSRHANSVYLSIIEVLG